MAYLRDKKPAQRTSPRRRGYVLNALAFSTLLSSQGTDAHLQQPPGRLQGNYSNLPDEAPPVNQILTEFWKQEAVGPSKTDSPTRFRGHESSPVRWSWVSPGSSAAFRRSDPRGARRTLEMDEALVKSAGHTRPVRHRACALLRSIHRGQWPQGRVTAPRKSPQGSSSNPSRRPRAGPSVR